MNRNYDASYAALSSTTAQGGNKYAALNAAIHAGQLRSSPGLKTKGFPSNYDAKLGTATFLWAPAGGKNAAAKSSFLSFSPVKPALRAETVARSYLGQQASYLRLDRTAVADARLSEVHDLGRGPIIARFQQTKDGLEVFGRTLNVMMDRNLNAVATSGYFAPAPAAARNQARAATAAPAFNVSAESALSRAFADMGGHLPASAFAARGSASGYTLYGAGRTRDDYQVSGSPRAKAVYYYSDGKYLPAWFVEMHGQTIDRANNDAYGYVISAVDGKILFRKDLTAYDNYTYHVFADSTAPFHPEDEPINNNTLDPFTGGATGDQGRTQGAYNLVTLNNSGQITDATAKNDPWLPSGATTTTGNNVVAFANIAGGDGFDSGDIRGAISSAGTFDYPYTIDVDPTTPSQRQAAIVNQFFVDNWLHDTWYEHGFNEAAGNAQADNYGRGGVAGDPIQAQAQDDSGRNNANMQTPPDGGSPIQRMFLWDGPMTSSSTVDITTPSSIGALNFNTADYGPHAFTATGTVLAPQSGDANGCNAITTDMTGAIALIDRGSCSFKTKTLNAQNAGAAAVIIADNRTEPPPGLGDDATITTPITIGTVSITQADGASIHTALGNGAVSGTVNVQFQADRDGTMDIQIVAHEFFHYVSNRLVGNALGLSSTQGGGMGEGWSDFDAMLLTVRPEDAAVSGNDKYQGAYPLSTYVTFSQYFGIRRTPYSTSFSIDPLTFKDISNGQPLPTTAPINGDTSGANNAEVHNTGEIWCNALWEVYAALLNDPRYTFAQAKSRMQDYIIEGLKMTPNAPTMLEARDALLAAARATDAGDFALMAKAFAKRGMGVDAVGPDRADPDNAGITESYNAIAAGVQVTDATLDFTVPANALGDLDGDGVLDAGETARLTLTFVNNGTADMAGPVTGQMTATPGTGTADVGFSNGGAVTVPALAIGHTAQVSVLVTLNSSSTTAQPLALTLGFPSANDPTGTIASGGTAAVGTEYDLVVNYDLQKNSTSDDVSDVQANLGDWALSNNGTAGPGWEIDDFNGFFVDQQTSANAWFGRDNDHPTDITLASPELDVATTGSFTLAFDHFFDLEFAGFDGAGNAYGFDGGVIEVSTDGGATWNDAFGSTIGATVTTGNGYNGFDLSLMADGTFDPTDSTNGHPAFIANNEDPNNPVLEHLVVNFGTKLAGQKVRVRFRETSDEGTGVFGWVVDNIAVTGVTNEPFSMTVADAGKAEQAPVAVITVAQQNLHAGDTVTLDGSGSTDPFGTALTYSWTFISGPVPVPSFSDATAAKPTVKLD
ncbi:MAG TPA: M36 family metallopeptidase, partial [Nevskia sp.]|nr:M36 family metallopeptidase [Nevskia sp.]